MINNYITSPTAFPLDGQLPWIIVENLCQTITLYSNSILINYEH